MISDLQLAQLCAATYNEDSPWDYRWDEAGVHFDAPYPHEGTVIAFRGSVDDIDWTRDFKGWPHLDPDIGYCHEGFHEGIDRAVSAIIKYLSSRRRFAITGHSLGAAHALLAAAKLDLAGLKPEQVTVFGCPRPGFGKLSGILQAGGYPITIYRNREDPVAEVPFAIPFLWPYQKPVADIELDAEPGSGPRPFSDHKIRCYVEGTAKLQP